MSNRTRKPTPQTPAERGLLDEGPHLQLDQNLLGNQALLEQGLLDFDYFDPSFSSGIGRPGPLADNSAILERIAAQGSPNPLVGGGPGAAPAQSGPSWLNPAGAGTTRGGWHLGFRPVTSTSDDLDDPGKRARGERIRQDEVVERQDPRSKP